MKVAKIMSNRGLMTREPLVMIARCLATQTSREYWKTEISRLGECMRMEPLTYC